MQQRVDEYFTQGHFQSAFSMLSARCDHFLYVQHLDDLIDDAQATLEQIETPQSIFVDINRSVSVLEEQSEAFKEQILVQ